MRVCVCVFGTLFMLQKYLLLLYLYLFGFCTLCVHLNKTFEFLIDHDLCHVHSIHFSFCCNAFVTDCEWVYICARELSVRSLSLIHSQHVCLFYGLMTSIQTLQFQQVTIHISFLWKCHHFAWHHYYYYLRIFYLRDFPFEWCTFDSVAISKCVLKWPTFQSYHLNSRLGQSSCLSVSFLCALFVCGSPSSSSPPFSNTNKKLRTNDGKSLGHCQYQLENCAKHSTFAQ